MKKTLLIIVAVLSTSLAFGQSVTIKRNAVPNDFETAIVKNSISAKDFQSLQKNNTKGAGDRLTDWEWDASVFELLSFGKASRAEGDSTGNNDFQFAFVNEWSADEATNARTKVNGETRVTSRLSTYEWFSTSVNEDLAKSAPYLVMSTEQGWRIPGWQFPQISTWVEFPSFSTNDRPVVIEWVEYINKYGNGHFLLTYSLNAEEEDPTWDSLVFNYNNPGFDLNFQKHRQNRVILPSKCNNQENVTVRFHAIGRQFLWVVSDLNIREADDIDIKVVYSEYLDNTFHKIPLGLNPRPMYWMGFIQNAGKMDLKNLQGVVTVSDESGNTISEGKTQLVASLPSTEDTLLFSAPIQPTSTYYAVPTDKKGRYSVTQKVVYDSFDVKKEVSFSQNPVYVDINYDDDEDLGIWSRDNGLVRGGNIWDVIVNSKGQTARGQGIDSVSMRNYGTLIDFNTHRFEDADPDLYIVGVQLVLDSKTQEGVAVRARLMNTDTTKTTDETIELKVSIDGEPRVTEAEHIGDFQDGYLYYEENGYNVFNLSLLDENGEGTLITRNQVYYAGFLLQDDKRFAVMRNFYQDDFNTNFISFKLGSGQFGGSIVLSPQAPTEELQKRFNYPYSTEGPMIRLLVSKNKNKKVTGIFTPKEVNFNLNAYPNPATNEINIGYLLDKSAKATIEIYDIFGRLVKIVDTQSVAGEYKKETINVSDLATGAYIYTLNVNGIKQSKKFIVTK